MHAPGENSGLPHADAMAAARALRGEAPSLAGWYGDPLPATAARCLEVATERELRPRLCTGSPVFPLQVLRLLCRYWTGAPAVMAYEQLAASAAGRRERALLELVRGQLLMSRRQRPALQHLERGFSLAADELAAADYFLLVRRHELLRHVPLADTASPPRGLQALLAEAAVILQLRGGERRACSVSHFDTLG